MRNLTRPHNNLQHKTLQPRRVITLGMEMARCHYGGFYWRLSTTCYLADGVHICVKQDLFSLLSKQFLKLIVSNLNIVTHQPPGALLKEI